MTHTEKKDAIVGICNMLIYGQISEDVAVQLIENVIHDYNNQPPNLRFTGLEPPNITYI